MKLIKSMHIFNMLKLNQDSFYVYGSFGSQFIKISQFIFYNKFYKLRKSFKVLILKLIGLKYGWRVRLKIIGRGLSFFKRNNYIYMNVGRSHIVRFYMNLYMRILCLKKLMMVLSKDFSYLRLISYMLITTQPPLLYKAKGLVYEFNNYKPKLGKKPYRV